MLKQLYFLTVVLLLGTFAFAQSNVTKRAPLLMDEPTVTVNSVNNNQTNAPLLPGWVTVDSMANSYGPASPTLNPFYFEPYAKVLTIVHRGGGSVVATGSGKLYYNYSTDLGVTWMRVETAINAGNTTQLGRYPSMAVSNPTKSTDINQTTAVFSWPELNPSAFGFLGYGADQPVGGNSPVSGLDQGPPTYSSNMPTFVSDQTNNMFWVTDNQENADMRLFRTADFTTVEKIDPPSWLDSTFGSGGNVHLGGIAKNGVLYYAVHGTFNNLEPIVSGWYPGLTKSTDDGTTWSAYDAVDFRLIPGLTAYDRLFDNKKGDAFVSYTGDMNVDADGYAHLLFAVTDTTIDNNTGVNALVELYQTAGGWAGKVVYSGLDNDIYTKYGNADDNPGIGQMGDAPFLAISEDGNFYCATWVDKNPDVTDTICAIYYSTRTKTTDWTPRARVTTENTMNFNGHHMTPKVHKVENGKYMTFHMVWYQAGVTTHPIVTTAANEIFFKSITHNVGTSVEDNNIVSTFELGQNYPNPFNPTTNIKYSVPVTGNVVLKVYDVLGREVATLLNTVQEAGSHSINFDASALSSGMYIYTLTTGNYTASKKMMLMK